MIFHLGTLGRNILRFRRRRQLKKKTKFTDDTGPTKTDHKSSPLPSGELIKIILEIQHFKS